MATRCLAHVRPEDQGEHDLADHLRGVAERARRFAECFGGGSHAELAGLWHDLGKYAADFQQMLRTATGVDAHLESESAVAKKTKVDHSTAGAFHAYVLPVMVSTSSCSLAVGSTNGRVFAAPLLAEIFHILKHLTPYRELGADHVPTEHPAPSKMILRSAGSDSDRSCRGLQVLPDLLPECISHHPP